MSVAKRSGAIARGGCVPWHPSRSSARLAAEPWCPNPLREALAHWHGTHGTVARAAGAPHGEAGAAIGAVAG